MSGKPIPARLGDVRDELEELHKLIHNDSNATGQTSPHLREAVSATSAALAAVRRAMGHVEAAQGGERR